MAFGGTEIGAIYAKISADLSDFDRALDVAKAKLAGFAADCEAAALATDVAMHQIGDAGNDAGDKIKRSMAEAAIATEAEAVVAEEAAVSQGILTAAVDTLGGAFDGTRVGIGAFSFALEALPVVAAVAVVGFVAMTNVLGALIAITAALVAPLTLLAGLAATMGGAFIFGGISAMKATGMFGGLAKRVDELKGMFSSLGRHLARDFLPYFWDISKAAMQALHYLIGLTNLPFDKAMKSLSTDGIKMLSGWVDSIAAVVAHPIRLAIRLAFAPNDFAGQVDSWWHRLTDFLFGYTKTKPIKITSPLDWGGGKLQLFKPHQVDGALQPIVDWFNRHDFTKQGDKIGAAIRGALARQSGPISKILANIFINAAAITGKAFGSLWLRGVMFGINLLPNLIAKAGQIGATGAANWIKTELGTAWDFVKGAASRAWDAIKAKAISIWNSIVNAVEHPLSVHINWPSPPSWLDKLGGLGGVLSAGAGLAKRLTATGGVVTSPQWRIVGEAGPEAIIPLNQAHSYLGGGGTTTVYISIPPGLNARQQALQIREELQRLTRGNKGIVGGSM